MPGLYLSGEPAPVLARGRGLNRQYMLIRPWNNTATRGRHMAHSSARSRTPLVGLLLDLASWSRVQMQGVKVGQEFEDGALHAIRYREA